MKSVLNVFNEFPNVACSVTKNMVQIFSENEKMSFGFNVFKYTLFTLHNSSHFLNSRDFFLTIFFNEMLHSNFEIAQHFVTSTDLSLKDRQ